MLRRAAGARFQRTSTITSIPHPKGNRQRACTDPLARSPQIRCLAATVSPSDRQRRGLKLALARSLRRCSDCVGYRRGFRRAVRDWVGGLLPLRALARGEQGRGRVAARAAARAAGGFDLASLRAELEAQAAEGSWPALGTRADRCLGPVPALAARCARQLHGVTSAGLASDPLTHSRRAKRRAGIQR
jgi:hypothetical protein